MKTILCYGDSNTWGRKPGFTERYGWGERWTGRLQALLGQQVRIVEEGLRGRTTNRDDLTRAGRNGKTPLVMLLESHSPIDLVLLMLGTNDLKAQFGLSAAEIAAGVSDLVQTILQFEPRIAQVIVLAPPHVVPTADAEMASMFAGAIPTSATLAEHYAAVAQRHGCGFINTNRWISSSPIDGIHIDLEAHRALAEVLADEVRRVVPELS